MLRAGKLADYALALGLDLVPEVVFYPSVTGRFARRAPGLSPVARRTLRTNQRFIARRAVPQLYPADTPLPRERAKAPYSAVITSLSRRLVNGANEPRGSCHASKPACQPPNFHHWRFWQQ